MGFRQSSPSPQVESARREASEAESDVPVNNDHLLSIIGVEPMEVLPQVPLLRVSPRCEYGPRGGMPSQKPASLVHLLSGNIEVLSVVCPSCFEQFDMGQIVLAQKDQGTAKDTDLLSYSTVRVGHGTSIEGCRS